MRVGVIGTGSSGIQSIPIIARQAADLTVFQRTPNFSMPAGNRPLAGSEITEMKASYRDWRERQRTSGFGVPVEPATQSALEVTEEQRQAAYQSGWDQGDLVSLIGSFTDTLTDIRANEHAAEFIRAQIRRIVSDPVTAEKLSPRTFPVGTKRPCLDTGYYATFNSPHVHLVDLRETPLVEFTEAGLRTSEREYEFDAIVFATGFDAMTGALTAIDIRGRDGVSLAATWAGGPRTYLGLAVAGFPNLFTVTGPLSPSVLSNMVVSIEQHVDWITDCVLHLRAAGHTAIEATAAAQDGWVQHVAEVGAHTLFPTAESWYMGSNVPGKPRVFMRLHRRRRPVPADLRPDRGQRVRGVHADRRGRARGGLGRISLSRAGLGRAQHAVHQVTDELAARRGLVKLAGRLRGRQKVVQEAAEQRVQQHRGGCAGGQLAAPLAAADDLVRGRDDVLGSGRRDRAEVVVEPALGHHPHPEPAPRPVELVCVRDGQRGQVGAHVAGVRPRESRVQRPEHVPDQLFLVPVAQVQGALADAGLLGHGLERERPPAAGGKRLDGRGRDPVPGAGVPRTAPAGRVGTVLAGTGR